MVLRGFELVFDGILGEKRAPRQVDGSMASARMSALSADDSCSRETPNACNLGALQAAMHAISSKVRPKAL